MLEKAGHQKVDSARATNSSEWLESDAKSWAVLPEQAAKLPSWVQEPPFRDNKLLPLSPPRSRNPLSPSLGSSIMSRLSREHTVVSPSGR